jgi:hypothetical protein
VTVDLHALAAKVNATANPNIRAWMDAVDDILQPVAPPPSVAFPRQGISMPLGNITGKSAADQDWMLDQIVALGNGGPMFLRTDWWPDNAGFKALAPKVAARPSLVLLPILNYDPGNRPTVGLFASQAGQLAALGYPYVNLLNEPNLGGWTPQDAAAYTNAARTAIAGRALVVGPDVATGANGQTPSTALAWVRAFVAAGGKVDVGAANLYGASSPPAAANPAWNLWSQASAIRAALGVPLLFCLEGGWKIASATPRSYDGYGTITDTEYQTASVKTGLSARDAGVVDSYIVYSLLNDASPGGYGLYDNRRVTRPSYAVFKAGVK